MSSGTWSISGWDTFKITAGGKGALLIDASQEPSERLRKGTTQAEHATGMANGTANSKSFAVLPLL